ncbi:MAG: hypothetical protein M9894_13005 [Planctomycetes bacterium]|nr:hypothetical protein [Planctomycetota bacterium]
MADESFDPRPSKKDTRSQKRPKRDPNQPFPRAQGGSLSRRLLVLVVGGAGVVALALVGLYSVHLGRPPWDWSEVDRAGFVDYSKTQVDEARAQVESIDWAALKDTITEKTRALWDQVPAWEQKLDKKLSDLRGGEAAPAAQGAAAAGPATTAAVEPPAPTRLELGCEAFREGIRHYKKSMNSQAELKRAKEKFRAAYDHLEAAHAQAEAKGDAAQADEIEGYLQQVNVYLEDCSKREVLERRR